MTHPDPLNVVWLTEYCATGTCPICAYHTAVLILLKLRLSMMDKIVTWGVLLVVTSYLSRYNVMCTCVYNAHMVLCVHTCLHVHAQSLQQPKKKYLLQLSY